MPTKILAIDDSKTMRLAIKITFAAEDCEVVAVSKGSEAVVRAKQMPADILIVDAVLAAGEPSGYEVARMLRADPETAHIPVLILVSNQTGIDEAQVQASGANAALTKPFDTQELLERVNALVSGKSVATKSTAPGKPVAGAATYSATASTSAPAPKVAPVAAAPAPQAAPAAARPPLATPQAAPGLKHAPTSPARPAAASVAPSMSSASASGQGQRLPAAFTSVEDMASKIPIAVPIPFAPAGAPTPGMLKRLQAAGGAASGLDPKAVEALLALSRDVVEQVVWEVVPDLAEHALKQRG
jgi:CheY-like chemotaxis protein